MTTNATHATIEGTPGPTFGGGYRVTIMAGNVSLASKHFPVPIECRTFARLKAGGDMAYQHAKAYCHKFGVE